MSSANAPPGSQDRKQMEKLFEQVVERGELKSTVAERYELEEAATEVPSQLGRYLIQEYLGRGSFGSVYKAWDPEVQRAVAIKVPRAGMLQSLEEVDAFLDEARRAGQFEHPGVVSVYDAGRDAGQCYIVCRYIEGPTLAQHIAARRLTINEAVGLVARLADTVHHAHRNGWVHRDIKPSNVLLDCEFAPYLADFGIAAQLDELRRTEHSGAGTLAYMAPEVVRRWMKRSHGDISASSIRPDHRADIYSLGVVLYQLLTHRLPFEHESPDALCDMILHSEAVPPRLIDEKIPARVEEICLKAIAKDTLMRYRTAADFRDDLLAAVSDAPIAMPHAESATVPSPVLSARYLGRHYAFLVGLPLLVLVGGAITLSSWPRAPLAPSTSTSAPASAPQTAEVVREVRELLREQATRRFRTHEGLPEPEALASESTSARLTPGSTDETKRKSEPLSLPVPFAGLEAEIAEARKKGDEKKEQDLLLKTTNELIDAGYFVEARAAAERMVELAGKDPARVPFAYGQLGLAQYRLGQAEQAIASYEESLKVYRSLYAKMTRYPDSPEVKGHLSHLARLVGISLMRIGNANKFLERYENAETAYLQAREVLELHERKSELMTLLSNLGSLQSLRGEQEAAVDTLKKSIALARELNDTKEESETLINLGNAHARAADNAAAIQSYRAAYELMTPAASYEARTAVLTNWITSLVDEGRVDEAEEMLAQLRRTVRPNDHESNRILRLLEPILTKRQSGE